MPLLRAIPNSLLLLWAMMLWPALPVVRGLIEGDWYYAEMMHISGVWSVYFLVASVAVTPVTLVIARVGRGATVGRWLIKRRRHFGLASFACVALHAAHYTVESQTFSVMLTEAIWLEYATGWAAFIIFLALAITSNDWSVRRLGRQWKPLHRWVYPAAALIAWHWYLFDDFVDDLALWGGVFVAAKAVQTILRRTRGRATV